MKIVHMLCPKCGASIKPDLDNEQAVCEYCGHYILIEQEDTIEEIREKAQAKSYGYFKGKMEAEAEAKAQARKNGWDEGDGWSERNSWNKRNAGNKKKTKFKGVKITFLVIGVIVLLSVFSEGVQRVSKAKVNPFDYIEVSFQGTDGKGQIVMETLDAGDDIHIDYVDFEVSKQRYLYEGETVTIKASCSDYFLTETSRNYTVEGLDEYLKDLEDIPREAMELIHAKAQSGQDMNLDRSKNAGKFVDMKPVKLFLVTDGKQTNRLYDVFEVHFTTNSGEKTYYVVTYFDDVIVHNGPQVSLDMSSGMYFGNLTQVEGALFIMAYDSLEEVRVDILTNQQSQMELKELELDSGMLKVQE